MGTQRSPARRRRDVKRLREQEAAWAARSGEVTVKAGPVLPGAGATRRRSAPAGSSLFESGQEPEPDAAPTNNRGSEKGRPVLPPDPL